MTNTILFFLVVTGFYLAWYWIKWKVTGNVLSEVERDLAVIESIMKYRFISRIEIKPVPPGQMPGIISESMDSVSGILEKNRFTRSAEFFYFVTDSSVEYLRVYINRQEKLIAAIRGMQIGESVALWLNFTTSYEDGTRVETTNEEPATPIFTIPHVVPLHYPDCMPEELLQRHREFIAGHKKDIEISPVPHDLSEKLVEDLDQYRDIAIKNGIYQEVKDGEYIAYTHNRASQLLEDAKRKLEEDADPHKTVDHSYETGFSRLNPHTPETPRIPAQPDRKKRDRWVFVLTVLYLLTLVYVAYNMIKPG